MFFVTRLKENAAYEVVASTMGPLPRNILADETIRFTGPQAVKDCPHLLRRVVVWDAVNKREIVLLTSALSRNDPGMLSRIDPSARQGRG